MREDDIQEVEPLIDMNLMEATPAISNERLSCEIDHHR